MAVMFIDSWTNEDDCVRAMKSAGLLEQGQNELGMSIRFSPRSNARYQLHRWALPTYKEAARFLYENKNYFDSGSFIVFDAQIPHFMAEILKRSDGSYHAELVPGTWITSGIEPTDYADIHGGDVVFNAYQRPRRVLARLERQVNNDAVTGTFIPRSDEPLNTEMIKVLARKMVETTQRLTVLSMPDMLYECCLNQDMVVHIKEAKIMNEVDLHATVKRSQDTYEIDAYEKLNGWDGIMPLHITVDVNKKNADMFQKLVCDLKGRVNTVYVKYGLLTHPAIILREAGIQPITLRSQYKEYRFTF